MLKALLRKKSLTQLAPEEGHGSGLKKVLNVRDLTFFGIAAIIGGGTFSAIGSACYNGGPAVVFLYIICAIACGFTAMCYAEFASRVPVSGSAYTYAYVSFGELFAWIIGWALIMEYSIGNIYIAFSWSGYFTNLLEAFNISIPDWLSINYSSAKESFIKQTAGKGLEAWKAAPTIAGLRIIFDLPALIINALITYLVYRGAKESKNVSNIMVYIKLAVILLVIIVGCFYIDVDNWMPFMPRGFDGVMAGVSSVFYAYIGFDAVSTLAEESKNPQRDLPKGMIYSLVACTVIYIILALVLTGMVSYELLGVNDPLAEIFAIKGLKQMLFIVSIAAVAAMTGVLLVFQMGQPRIWMTMSRDGLMPKRFASIHPKYKTPGFATIITGLVVGIPILFTNDTMVLDFTSIGTLFAFVLVCGGILLLPRRTVKEPGKFNLTYINGKFIFPAMVIGAMLLANTLQKNYFGKLFNYSVEQKKVALQQAVILGKDSTEKANIAISHFNSLRGDTLLLMDGNKFETSKERLSYLSNTANDFNYMNEKTKKVSTIIFWLILLGLAVISFLKNYSLIPLLGLASCLYLLTGMTYSNWVWFGAWFALGLIIYFVYSRHNSRLAKNNV
jgi:basic amino acid/polyamine antiporter, APA family